MIHGHVIIRKEIHLRWRGQQLTRFLLDISGGKVLISDNSFLNVPQNCNSQWNDEESDSKFVPMANHA